MRTEKCDHDCFNCKFNDCINNQTPNALSCARWYEKNKERKREYQREYQREYRKRKAALLVEGA